MARNYATLSNSAAVALSSGVAKTVLQVKAVTVRLAVQSITVTFDGVSNSATPVTILVQFQSSAGTATSRTLVKKDKGISTALQCTGQENCTVEPTADGDVLRYFCHPQVGIKYELPLPGEIILPPNEYLGVTINAPANVDTLCDMEVEE